MLSAVSLARNNFIAWFKKAKLGDLCLVFAVWVFVVVGISYFAANELYGITVAESNAVNQANNLPSVKVLSPLGGLAQWDSRWFILIASHGYKSDPGTPQGARQDSQAPAFFPLYPAIMRPFVLLGANPVVIGVGINLIFSFGALMFLYRIALHFLKEHKIALRACMLFLYFPTSYYLLSVYSEALFCLLSFGAFYFALKRKWLYVGLLLALCTATRSSGVFVAIAIFFEYLHSINFKLRKLDKNFWYFLLAPLGILAFAGYLLVTFDDPLLMFKAQSNWHQGLDINIVKTVYRQTAGVIKNFITPGYNAFGTDWAKEWTNLIVWSLWVLGLVLTIRAWITRCIPRSWAVYMSLSLLFFVSKGNFISVNRYMLVLFPMYILLARYTQKRESAYTSLLVGFAALMIFGLVDFSISYWTG